MPIEKTGPAWPMTRADLIKRINLALNGGQFMTTVLLDVLAYFRKHPEEPECTCPDTWGRFGVFDPACPKHGAKPPTSTLDEHHRIAHAGATDVSCPECDRLYEPPTTAEAKPPTSAQTDAWRWIANGLRFGGKQIEADALSTAADALDVERAAHEETKRELSEITKGSLHLSAEVERLTRELADSERNRLEYRAELARRSGK